MKILYFVNYFPPISGAASLNSLNIIRNLLKMGNSFLVLAPKNMGNTLNLQNNSISYRNSNLNLVYSNSLIKFPFSLIFSHFENMVRYLVKLKKNFKPDVIISQYHAFHYASVAGAYTSKILNIPHVIRSHDIFVSLDTQSFLRKLFHLINYPAIHNTIPKCKIFYVTTSEMKNYLSKFKRLENVPFKVQHNGIDTNQFHPIKYKEKLKDKYGCENIISFIGLITPEMGLQNLIKVLPEILKNIKETHIIIIGDGYYKKTILDLISKNNLNKNVHFLGIKPHSRIPFYINNSDIGIGLLNHRDMWRYCIPVKCLEYMACQKPFITTPVSKDLINNNDVGIVIEKNLEGTDLRDYLITLLEDKNLRESLGKNGIQKVNQKFKWDNIIEDFNADLKNVIKIN